MTNKIILALIFVILIAGFVSAETSYCCEKTTYGASCQNDAEINCNSAFRKAPTHCDSTDYCRRGCCYNSNEGTCSPNTAEGPCLEAGGLWEDSETCDVPQCNLGCCILGDQATFVTQTRCKRLSTLYGIGVNFKQNIKSEFECIAETTSQEKGACVFEKDFERTCSIMNRKDCLKQGQEIEFYAGRLCSDEALGTNCAPSDQTICVEGRDQVYYLDTCGNIANIYDSTKRLTTSYWAEMKDPLQSCSPPDSPQELKTCGNCDYFLGTTCKSYDSALDAAPPEIGDNICRDLSCMYDNDKDGVAERYEHGEKWCGVSGGVSQIFADDLRANTNPTIENLPGSRYYKLMCYNGEVVVEPCEEFRASVCIQGEIVTGFKTAECRVNRWQDCTTLVLSDYTARFPTSGAEKWKKDCEDEFKRDCRIIQNICVPKYAPGFDFWADKEKAQDMCGKASSKCVVTYESDGDIDSGHNCIDGSFVATQNAICSSLGDCGGTVNYLDFEGDYNLNDLTSISGYLDNQGEVNTELAREYVYDE